jgi:iron complex transport system substrate-binding protein
MKRRSCHIVMVLVWFWGVGTPWAADVNTAGRGNGGGRCPYRRIVSLAPSVTEVLFALGLGDRVAGVTRYCGYPPEARTKPQVGGYVDPNYEELLRLRPDLTILLTVHTAVQERLRHLGLTMLSVDHTTVQGILSSVMTIGEACGAAEEAGVLTDDITARMDRVRKATEKSPRPRVLVAVDRTTDVTGSVYIAGRNTFYEEIVSIAGGVNAYEGAAAYPAVSIEGILQMDPQVVVDMVPGIDKRKGGRKKALARWSKIAAVEGVRKGRVYLFDKDYTVIPGPRFIVLVEEMARALHPELFGK